LKEIRSHNQNHKFKITSSLNFTSRSEKWSGRKLKHDEPADDAGFTLLELMVAIFIFGIVITSIFASYSAVFTSADVVSSGIDLYDMANICLNRITLDLQAMHLTLPPKYRKPELDSDPDPYRVVGEASDPDAGEFPRLRFGSLAHIPFDRADYGGIARIVYYVQEGLENNYRLKRSDTLSPAEPFERNESDPVLCDHVKSLKFVYYDQEGTGHEDWNSETDAFQYATPVAIEVSLEIERDGHTVHFATNVKIPVSRGNLE
jgi:general secretion pathway protein J